MLHFHILSLFPESIKPYLDASMLGRSQKDIEPHGSKPGRKALVKISYYNPRDYSTDERARVDRRPYGGGPGMVMEPESMLKAAAAALKGTRGATVLFFSPSGKQFDAKMARELSKKKNVLMICGHYEGVDARVAKILKADAITVGPYVLTGGELPAATVIDAVVRQIPGVLGKYESLEEERTASPDVYTRPEVLKWKGKNHSVPKVLLGGNHAEIEAWKRGQQN
jgi:tRNA (guanine37-N1)-methyltransferase